MNRSDVRGPQVDAGEKATGAVCTAKVSAG